MICNNCNNPINQKFCGFCGQSVSMNQKIKPKDIATDIFHSIFHTGGGLFFTMKILITNPELVLQGYLAGKRKVYFSPIKLFLIFGVLYITISHYVNEKNPDQLTKGLDYYVYHYKYFVMFFPVLISALLNWAIYGRKQLSFTEHFIVIMYVQSMVYLLSCCVMLANFLSGFHMVIVGILLEMTYYVYATTRFYCNDKPTRGVVLNLAIYAVATLSVVLFLYYLANR